MSFDQRTGTAITTDSEDTGSDSSYGQAASNRRQSIRSNIQGSCNKGQQTSRPIVDPVLTSWIRKLSDINMELHQHMLSILPIEVGQFTWANTKDKRKVNGSTFTQHARELAVDRTLELSHQYTEVLNDIFSQFKTRQECTGPTIPARIRPTFTAACLIQLSMSCRVMIKPYSIYKHGLRSG